MAPIEWVEGDALNLPFDEDAFDCATIAYGLRNVSDIPKALDDETLQGDQAEALGFVWSIRRRHISGARVRVG